MFIPFPKLVNGSSNEYDHYLDKDNTLPIKGFFVILVFLAHFKQYIDLSSSLLDMAFDYIHKLSGQLIVTMFLFYEYMNQSKQKKTI